MTVGPDLSSGLAIPIPLLSQMLAAKSSDLFSFLGNCYGLTVSVLPTDVSEATHPSGDRPWPMIDRCVNNNSTSSLSLGRTNSAGQLSLKNSLWDQAGDR